MDRSKCWVTSQVLVTIEHCPSAASEIVREVDRVVQFIRGTELPRFGKVRISSLNTTDSPAVGEHNAMSGLLPKTDLRRS
jgi:hypothetical protein